VLEPSVLYQPHERFQGESVDVKLYSPAGG
jgi:hypothetical protein